MFLVKFRSWTWFFEFRLCAGIREPGRSRTVVAQASAAIRRYMLPIKAYAGPVYCRVFRKKFDNDNNEGGVGYYPWITIDNTEEWVVQKNRVFVITLYVDDP